MVYGGGGDGGPEQAERVPPPRFEHWTQRQQQRFDLEIAKQLPEFNKGNVRILTPEVVEEQPAEIETDTGTISLTQDQWDAISKLVDKTDNYNPWTSEGAFVVYAALITAVVGPLLVAWFKRKGGSK